MSGDWNQTPLPDGTIRVTKRNRINPLTGKPRPATTAHTDRRDADETTFQAMRDRIENTPASDKDTVEKVARAICESEDNVLWAEWPDYVQETYRGYARAAIEALKPAPGADSNGQAVQRVLKLHQRIEGGSDAGFCTGCDQSWPCRTYLAAVAGPQRDHDQEQQP